MSKKVPSGVGVMILNKEGKVLIGKRHPDPKKAGSKLHGEGTWTFPGGSLELGETFEEAGIRETKEECGLVLKNIRVLALNQDMDAGAHFVTIGLFCDEFEGEPKVLESDTITKWEWFDLNNLPTPMYLPSKKLLENYKEKKFYIKN